MGAREYNGHPVHFLSKSREEIHTCTYHVPVCTGTLVLCYSLIMACIINNTPPCHMMVMRRQMTKITYLPTYNGLCIGTVHSPHLTRSDNKKHKIPTKIQLGTCL